MSVNTVERGSSAISVGNLEHVATAAAAHRLRAMFARRHPLITFLLLPIPALMLLWTGYTLGLIGILKLFHGLKDVDWAVTLAGVLIHGLAYAPAVALTLVIAWLALRSEARVAWWLAASGLVAFLSGLMMINFHVPTTPGTGQLQVGLGFPPDLRCWPQFVVPLGVALALVAYAAMKRRSAPWQYH